MKYLQLILASLLFSGAIYSQEKTKKAEQLDEVKIIKQNKPIEQKADRTIFEFASQAHLSSGSVLEGLKKLPGLLVSDVAGMLYQGKQLEVYLDGRPLNISSNELTAYLEGMPANSVKKIEIITNPGAEFPATSGGAIINIITSKIAQKYLSATYSNSTNFTNYDKLRTRASNSLLLNARNKYFSWQFNFGQNYKESHVLSTVKASDILLSNINSDRINRNNFAKLALTFDFDKDRLILNYDTNRMKNRSYTLADGFGFVSNDVSNNKNVRQEVVATYQKRFSKPEQKLDFRFNFSQNDTHFLLFSRLNNVNSLDNTSLQNYYNFKVDYSQALPFLNQTKLTAGALWDRLNFETQNFSITNLEYYRNTQASYAELQTKLKKIDFTLGARAENYHIDGKTTTSNLIPFDKFKVFPNASFQYNFIPQIYFNLNYNKKISLPSTSSLNPNNTNYQNPNINYSGNPQLQPTIFNNYEAKISAFDYAYVGYSISSAKNQVVNRVFQTSPTQLLNTSINVSELTIYNFNFGFPLPYMLFSKGIKETMKFDVNPDTMNFLYIYTDYQKHIIPDLQTKGFWTFNLMSQIILPKKVKFVANFNYNTIKGNYYYFVANKPFYQSVDLNFSRKFLSENLSVAINCDDVFNTNIQSIQAVGTTLNIGNKYDTRRFGFSINYKIPTKNKLAKENQNMLNKDKKEEGGLGGN